MTAIDAQRLVKRSPFRTAVAVALVAFAVVWAPWLILRARADIVRETSRLPKADTAIIFGGLHQGETLSETNEERLRTGVRLWQDGHVAKLVVSNMPQAAEAMKAFLVANGVPDADIEIDKTATITQDTCVAERNAHPIARNILFVSHTYHLPRLAFLCEQSHVTGTSVAAETFGRVDRRPLPAYAVLTTRFARHQREALLVWLALVGIYRPTVEKTD